MNIYFACLLGFWSISSGLLLFMTFRNHWVHDVRSKLLHEDYDEFKKLVSYNQMYWKVWIWDINKFKKENIE